MVPMYHKLAFTIGCVVPATVAVQSNKRRVSRSTHQRAVSSSSYFPGDPSRNDLDDAGIPKQPDPPSNNFLQAVEPTHAPDVANYLPVMARRM